MFGGGGGDRAVERLHGVTSGGAVEEVSAAGSAERVTVSTSEAVVTSSASGLAEEG
jgi:hypothetical protein